jgi:hypothetical protein
MWQSKACIGAKKERGCGEGEKREKIEERRRGRKSIGLNILTNFSRLHLLKVSSPANNATD